MLTTAMTKMVANVNASNRSSSSSGSGYAIFYFYSKRAASRAAVCLRCVVATSDKMQKLKENK